MSTNKLAMAIPGKYAQLKKLFVRSAVLKLNYVLSSHWQKEVYEAD